MPRLVRTAVWRLLVVALSAVPAAYGAQPQVHCPNPVRNLGEIRNRDRIEQTFSIQNRGTAELRLGPVRTSCGCLDARLSRETLPPGEIATVTVVFNIEGRRGEHTLHVDVHTNDPDRPVQRLTLAADIQWDLSVEPEWVTLREILGHEISDAVVTVKSLTDRPIELRHVDTREAAFCRVKVTPVRRGFEYRLQVRIAPEAPREAGRYTGEIKLLTDHPDYETVSIPVSLFVRREITVTPPALVMRPAGSVGTRYLLVRSLLARPCKVLDVVAPMAGVRYGVRALKPTQHRIALSGFKPSRALHETVIRVYVEDADGQVQVVEVPIRVEG